LLLGTLLDRSWRIRAFARRALQAGASDVVSILDPDWPVPSAFGACGEHQRLELRFDDVIE